MEEAHAAFPLIDVALVITVAVLLGVLFMRLRQPPLVGFIIAGVVMGPTGLGFVRTDDAVTALAEMGVLVLLFFIGMEISLRAFVVSLRPAVIVAAGQLLAGLAVGLPIALITGGPATEGIVLGFIIALSSTVVAMKMLDEMGELRRGAGRIAIAVLIAQDIAVVPMLILIEAFGGEEVSPFSIAAKMIVAVGTLAFLLWWLGRRGKLRVPFASQLEGNVEMLSLIALATCFGGAALSGYAGLSPVYGAFLAGLVLGSSTLRGPIIPAIEPIQSVLLVIFFLSIGLLIDLDYILANVWLVASVSLVVIAAKSVLNIQLLSLAGMDRETSLVSGLSMAQIGEFSFVLATAALSAGALGFDIYRLAIAVTAVSLLFSPAWTTVMHLAEDIRMHGYSTYRQAISTNAEEFAQKGFTWSRRRRLRARAIQKAVRLRMRAWSDERGRKRAEGAKSRSSAHGGAHDH